jgi:hypothetical protein
MIIILMTTHNGADTLQTTLEGLTRVVPPPGGWEIIAVDNGSSDRSKAILSGYSRKLPLAVLNEPRIGKNFALNRALDHLGSRAAEAELIVFCDDDIVPDPDWLCRLADAAALCPWADMFGGAIYPRWTSPVPEWLGALERYYGALFAVTRSEEGPCEARALFGPNMAIRGDVFRSGIRFDPRFGPNGTEVYPMGSETEFVDRLEAQGHRAYFAPQARVGHIVGESQLTEEWVQRRAYRVGLGAALRGRWQRHKLRIAGIPIRLLLSVSKSYAIVWGARLVGRRDWARIGSFRVNWHRGVFDGITRRDRVIESSAKETRRVLELG